MKLNMLRLKISTLFIVLTLGPLVLSLGARERLDRPSVYANPYLASDSYYEDLLELYEQTRQFSTTTPVPKASPYDRAVVIFKNTKTKTGAREVEIKIIRGNNETQATENPPTQPKLPLKSTEKFTFHDDNGLIQNGIETSETKKKFEKKTKKSSRVKRSFGGNPIFASVFGEGGRSRSLSERFFEGSRQRDRVWYQPSPVPCEPEVVEPPPQHYVYEQPPVYNEVYAAPPQQYVYYNAPNYQYPQAPADVYGPPSVVTDYPYSEPRENLYNVPIYEHHHVPLTTTSPVPDIATLYPYPPQDPISESNLYQTPVPTPSLVYGPPETETKKPVIHVETAQTDDRSDIPIEPQQVYGLPTDRSIVTEAEIAQTSTTTKKDLRKKLYYNEHSSGKRTDFTGGASAPLELPQEIKSSNYENNFRSTSLRLPKGHSGLFHNTTKNESTTASVENEESEQSNLGTVRAVYYKNFSISVIPDTSKFTTTETSVSGEDTTNKTIQTEKKTDESKAENITAIYSKQLEVLNNLNKEKLSQYSYFLPKQTDNGSRKWDMLNKYKIYYLNRVDSTEKSATKDFDHSIDTKLSNRPHAFYNAPISETPSPLNVHKFSPASSEMQKMSQFHRVAQDLKKMILNKAQTFSYSFTAKTPANQNNFKQSSGSLNQNHAFINSVVSKEKTRPATVYGPPLDVRYNANQGKSATPTYPKSTFSYSYTAKTSNNHENSKQEHSSNSQKHSSNTYFKPATVYGAPALDKAGPAISTRLPNLQKVSEFHKIAQNFKTMALNQAQTYNLNAKHQPTVGSSVSYSYTAKTSNNQENSKQEHSSNSQKHSSNTYFKPAAVYGAPALDKAGPAISTRLPNLQKVSEFHKIAQNFKTMALNQAQTYNLNAKHQPTVGSSVSYSYTAKTSNNQENSKQEHSSNTQKHFSNAQFRPATVYGVPALDLHNGIPATPSPLPNIQQVYEFHKNAQNIKTTVLNQAQSSYKNSKHQPSVESSISYTYTAKSSNGQGNSKQGPSSNIQKHSFDDKIRPATIYGVPALDIHHSLNKGKYSISDTPTHIPNLQKVSEFHKVVQDLKTKVPNHQQVSYTSKTKEKSSNVTPSFSYGFTAKSSTNQSHSKQQDLHKVDIEYKSKPLPVYSAPYAHYVTNNQISSTSADSKQENHQTSTVSYSYTAKAISNQHNLKQSVKISKPNTVYGVSPLEAQQNSLDFQRNEYKSHDSYVYPKPTDSLLNLSSQLHLPKSEQSVPFEYHPILNEKTNEFRKNHFFNKQTFYEIPFDSSTPHNSQHKKVLYKVVKRPLNNR